MLPSDVNTKDSFGKTPLHNAILGKQVAIVEVLLNSGADVKCLDERSDTPLHNAVRVGSLEIVEVRTSSSMKLNDFVSSLRFKRT